MLIRKGENGDDSRRGKEDKEKNRGWKREEKKEVNLD